jgi:hypothetical protein
VPTGTVTYFGSELTTGGGGPAVGGPVDEWTDTIAVDADPDGVRGAKYGYSWDYNNNSASAVTALTGAQLNVKVPSGVTDANTIPLFRIADGGLNAEFTAIPQPSYFFSDPSDNNGIYHYWSGGEVFQETGAIYFTGAECTSLAKTFEMMTYDTARGDYNYSGAIQPATPNDAIFGNALNPCPGDINTPGYVASDMALDGNGNAYILVWSNLPAPVFGLTTKADRWWLVRVTPGGKNVSWTYELVAPLTAGPGQTGAGFVTGAAAFVYGLAFYQGWLYVAGDGGLNLWRVNPMSGQVSAAAGTTTTGITVGAVYDLASAQTASVVEGTVYNDVNADGSIAVGDKGLAGQTLALYMKDPQNGNWVYEGTRTTNGSGHYSFMLGGNGDYLVRLVQPKIGGANAWQTYATGSEGKNPVTAHCAGGDVTSGGGSCTGAHAAPAVDPAPPDATKIGSATTLETDMPMYSTIKISTDEEVPTVDFGVGVRASYGDAKVGPASLTDKPPAPMHNNVGAPEVYLGSQPGTATLVTNDSHSTDDGLTVLSYDGVQLSLAGATLVAERPYTLTATVGGAGADRAKVASWVYDSAAAGGWQTSSMAWGGVDTSGHATVQFTPKTTSTWLRADASITQLANGITQATNTSNEYYDGTGSGTSSWTTPGEIEDYSLKVADAAYRTAITTLSGAGNFAVSSPGQPSSPSQTLWANSGDYVIGQSTGTSAGPQSITVQAPDATWHVVSALVKDQATGEAVTEATVSEANGAATITWSLAVGQDVIVELVYSGLSLTGFTPGDGPLWGGDTCTATGSGFVTFLDGIQFDGSEVVDTGIVAATGLDVVINSQPAGQSAYASDGEHLILGGTDPGFAGIVSGMTVHSGDTLVLDLRPAAWTLNGATVYGFYDAVSRTLLTASGGTLTGVMAGAPSVVAPTTLLVGGTGVTATVTSPTTLTCEALPAHDVGLVDVAVTVDGTPAKLTDAYRYWADGDLVVKKRGWLCPTEVTDPFAALSPGCTPVGTGSILAPGTRVTWTFEATYTYVDVTSEPWGTGQLGAKNVTVWDTVGGQSTPVCAIAELDINTPVTCAMTGTVS